ncbi:hypothetical protein [Rhodococcus rhodnii]|uniref:Secreted protein n=1 Tax=Rhodococcus rhodnii LMG 5362 TaxID=1273125 RepID=R7WML6_9NOCA|nr:hypothetical protein [Rhodococcus rhodnii]EOM76538.1 hypothetical protein Rrhod_2078 [Rhodococcus rhodnii LMG 5362]
MTLLWFGLAALALVGAVVLLYIDRTRRSQSGRVREIWAKAQGYDYRAEEPHLASRFHRAAMSKKEHDVAQAVVRGTRRGETFVLFDIEDSFTVVAVERPLGSGVDIDLRQKSAPAPRDADLELLGAIGDRVIFATEPEIARRACDQRMVAFTDTIPDTVGMLWSEGKWTLGTVPIGAGGRDWDRAIETVARLSGILHVLPPEAEPRELQGERRDPGRPEPRQEQRSERPRPAPEQRPGPQVAQREPARRHAPAGAPRTTAMPRGDRPGPVDAERRQRREPAGPRPTPRPRPGRPEPETR